MYDIPNALSRRAPIRTYVLLLGWLFLLLVDIKVTISNLIPGKIFAGHDNGFYNYFPDHLLPLTTSTWNFSSDFGKADFVQPTALLFLLADAAISSLHISAALESKLFFFLFILLIQVGSFCLASIVLRKTFPDKPQAVRWICAFAAATLAAFNPYTAFHDAYPPNTYQIGLSLWPLIIACGFKAIESSGTRWSVVLGVLLVIATMGNPAHVLIGILVLVALFALYWREISSRLAKIAITTAVIGCFTTYIWLPMLLSAAALHGSLLAHEGLFTDLTRLWEQQTSVAARASIGALLRFDGLAWWSNLNASGLYGKAIIEVAGYGPFIVALLALLHRDRLVRFFWITLLLGLELSKGVHPPFGLNTPWLIANVPVFAMFHETYDKFMLLVLIALPVCFAIGLARLYAPTRARALALGLALLSVTFSSYPWVAGRVAQPVWQTTIPPEYKLVDGLMGGSTSQRVLSLPGNYLNLASTSWFKGANGESLIFRASTVNGALFRQRTISSAPIYDDTELQQVNDLPALLGMLDEYGITYVLIHKDVLTEYSALYPTVKTNGPLLSSATEQLLDHDSRVSKIFEGDYLVLYRKKGRPAPMVYAPLSLGLYIAYENALFSASDFGMAGTNSALFVSGNQPLLSFENLKLFERAARFNALAPLFEEPPSLYAEQISLDKKHAAEMLRHVDETKPTAIILQHQHGDYINGYPPLEKDISGSFSIRSSMRNLKLLVSGYPRRVPREIIAEYYGNEGARAWAPTLLALDRPPDLGYWDAAQVPDAVETGVAPYTLTYQNSSATYNISFRQQSPKGEAVEFKRDLPPLSLRDDPKITMYYEFGSSYEIAWLRSEFVGPGGRRLVFDRQLDPNASALEDFDPRDALQHALDTRYADFLSQVWYDRPYLERQPYFNAEQSDDYYLTGLRIIVAKNREFSTLDKDQGYLFTLRGLKVTNTRVEAPAFEYASAIKRVEASDIARAKKINLTHVQSELVGGVHLITASVDHHLIQSPQESLPGLAASFLLEDGATVTGNVLSESPSAFVVATNPDSDQLDQLILSKSAIKEVTSLSTPGVGSMTIRIRLPRTSIARAPTLKVRYWLGTADERIQVHLGFQTARGLRSVVPGLLVVPGKAEQSIPDEWIGDSSVPLFDEMRRPASTINEAVRVGENFSQTGWHELSADLRAVASYRADAVRARLEYIDVTFQAGNTSSDFRTRAFQFALYQIELDGQVSSANLSTLRGSTVVIDNRERRASSVRRLDNSDVAVADFGAISLRAGSHNISTALQRPWLARAVTFMPDKISEMSRSGEDRTTVTWKSVSPTLYWADVPESSAGIVFSETYHPGWKLFRTTGPAPRNRFGWFLSMRWLWGSEDERSHYVANSFANGWIRPDVGRARYVIDFVPDDFFLLGAFVSAISFLVFISFVFIKLSPRFLRK